MTKVDGNTVGTYDEKKCKSCKEFKRCVNFAGYPAKANDNICPYYVPKKQVPRGQMKNGTALLLEWGKIKENENENIY